MDNRLDEYPARPTTAAGLPWHKPIVERLDISLDTDEVKGGSTEDSVGAFTRGVTEPD